MRNLVSDTMLEQIAKPMMATREALWGKLAKLHREVLAIVKEDKIGPQLITVPGIGAMMSLTYRAAVDDTKRFLSKPTTGRFRDSLDYALYICRIWRPNVQNDRIVLMGHATVPPDLAEGSQGVQRARCVFRLYKPRKVGLLMLFVPLLGYTLLGGRALSDPHHHPDSSGLSVYDAFVPGRRPSVQWHNVEFLTPGKCNVKQVDPSQSRNFSGLVTFISSWAAATATLIYNYAAGVGPENNRFLITNLHALEGRNKATPNINPKTCAVTPNEYQVFSPICNQYRRVIAACTDDSINALADYKRNNASDWAIIYLSEPLCPAAKASEMSAANNLSDEFLDYWGEPQTVVSTGYVNPKEIEEDCQKWKE